jgi:hypothetical protein
MTSPNAPTTPVTAPGQTLDITHAGSTEHPDTDHNDVQIADIVNSLIHPNSTAGATSNQTVIGAGDTAPTDNSAMPGAQAPNKSMTDTELLAIINSKINNSHQWYGSGKLASKRINADKYYRGEPMGNEIDGRSQVVSRDVAEAIDSMMPSFMRVFASGDRICVFEPATEKDQDAADQATDYINHIITQDNNGFEIFYTWIKDSLLKKNGIVKIYRDVRNKRTKDVYTGLTLPEFQTLATDPTLTVSDVKQYPDPQNPQSPGPPDQYTGQPTMVPNIVVDCVVVTTKPVKKFVVENVPPDEFIVERRTPSIDKAGFLAHRGKRTISDLLECGFDPDKVASIPPGDDQDYTQERTERFADEDQMPFTTESDLLDKSMQRVWITEAYLLVDYDGDGIAEWRKVTVAAQAGESSTVLLGNEETDDHAFADLTPNPECHKFYGESIYDKTHDIQDIKTAVVRGMLDSIYLANAPRYGVVGAGANMDDMLDVRPGGVVRLTNASAIVPLPTVMVAPQAQQIIEYFDKVRQDRVGSGPQTGALSKDILDANAVSAALATDAGQQRLELIARVFAERGFKRLYRRVFQLTCQYQDEARVVRLRNKWVNIDPRDWKDRMDVTVAVGAGSANKVQQAAIAQGILNVQKQVIAGGGHGKLVTDKNVYNTLVKLVEASGWKTPDPYFTDPDSVPPPPPPGPSPEEKQHMAKMQVLGVDLQMKQIDREMKLMDVELKRLEAAILLGEKVAEAADKAAEQDAGDASGEPPFMPGMDSPMPPMPQGPQGPGPGVPLPPNPMMGPGGPPPGMPPGPGPGPMMPPQQGMLPHV